MKLYIAGPCSDLPELNYPAFNREAAYWRDLGHEVVNPAENPEPACKSWVGYMRISVAQLAGCDGAIMLPGWEKSKGACIEHRLAKDLDLLVIYLRREGKPA